MTRFTVIWLEEARDELAAVWLAASDRAAITKAANIADHELARDPENKGLSLSESLYRLDVSPLRIYYTVRHDDRQVEVSNVLLVP